MKKAKKFQEWIIEEILPKLRKYGKYENDKKVKYKLDKLNEKIKNIKRSNKVLKEELKEINIHRKCIYIYLKIMEYIKQDLQKI